MTGRLQQGDHVQTRDGVGIIVASYIPTDRAGAGGWHVVQLDDGRRPYRTDQVKFIGRQLHIDKEHTMSDTETEPVTAQTAEVPDPDAPDPEPDTDDDGEGGEEELTQWP